MERYKHKVNYYETDKMGITHHSNYVRWMEEARTDFLSKIGWNFDRLEGMGIVSPVTSVECKYKLTTTFPDEVEISVELEKYSGVRLRFKYIMYNSEGKKVCTGSTEHCFVDGDGNILRICKDLPEFDKKLLELVKK